LINPFFFDNIIFGFRYLPPKILGQAEIRVGKERSPDGKTQLLGNLPLALITLMSGVVALGLRNQRGSTRMFWFDAVRIMLID
jgi:hypothetical protein